jgi:hypothetical protein
MGSIVRSIIFVWWILSFEVLLLFYVGGFCCCLLYICMVDSVYYYFTVYLYGGKTFDKLGPIWRIGLDGSSYIDLVFGAINR